MLSRVNRVSYITSKNTIMKKMFPKYLYIHHRTNYDAKHGRLSIRNWAYFLSITVVVTDEACNRTELLESVNILSLNMRGPHSVQHNKYHDCWCSGSLRRQDISTYDID